MATGVLPLVLGRFTRLAQFFTDASKVYEGEMRFGFSTDTYDAEGSPVGPISEVQPTMEEIHRHLPAFTGRIQQLPPIYSAKKINGVAAYKLARKDKPVEMKSVEVEIRRFEIQSVCGGRARFVAEVSAGTYIRSLAHDLGQALGCGAHLTQLRRTVAGEFNLSQTVSLDGLASYQRELTECVERRRFKQTAMSDNVYSDNVTKRVIPAAPLHPSPYLHPRQVLSLFPSVTATREVITAIRNGRTVNLPEFSEAPLVKVFADQELLIAVMHRIAGTLFQSQVVLYGSNEPLPV
jgi:tRNA pseudouridine55 synthase